MLNNVVKIFFYQSIYIILEFHPMLQYRIVIDYFQVFSKCLWTGYNVYYIKLNDNQQNTYILGY